MESLQFCTNSPAPKGEMTEKGVRMGVINKRVSRRTHSGIVRFRAGKDTIGLGFIR